MIPTGYLRTDDAARHLGITRQTFDNQARTSDFPKPEHIGRTPLWRIVDLDAWRARHPARRKPGRDATADASESPHTPR